MARWLAQLSGDRPDLEEYLHSFPDGDIFAIEENGSVYITGPGLESFTEAGAVLEEAQRVLAHFTAAISFVVAFKETEITASSS
ncbi:MAG TPA: hypothetical protein VJ809_13010 [Pirellulales bacterium]|nr:hypothetical protein [Pirellulales bacterium]